MKKKYNDYQVYKLVKKYCEEEIKINKENSWETISDGTGDIFRGRLEFAEGLLNQIYALEKMTAEIEGRNK